MNAQTVDSSRVWRGQRRSFVGFVWRSLTDSSWAYTPHNGETQWFATITEAQQAHRWAFLLAGGSAE